MFMIALGSFKMKFYSLKLLAPGTREFYGDESPHGPGGRKKKKKGGEKEFYGEIHESFRFETPVPPENRSRHPCIA